MRQLIVVGGSAGALDPLMRLVSLLPADLPAAVVVVIHTSPTSGGRLASLLERKAQIAVVTATDGAPLREGQVVVAPGDHHVIVIGEHLHLSRSPRENGHRPAIDPLFRSAARAFDSDVTGIVLSGLLDDGSAGLALISARGGTAIVQEPSTAQFPDLPENALRAAPGALALDIDSMASLLVDRGQQATRKPGMSEEQEVAGAHGSIAGHPSTHGDRSRPHWVPGQDTPGQPSGYSCPDCGGVLSDVEDSAVAGFRCRIGHRYSPQALLEAQANTLEGAVWAAVRALEEQASLADRLSERAAAVSDRRTAERFEERAATAREQARLVRQAMGVQPPARELDGDDDAPAA